MLNLRVTCDRGTLECQSTGDREVYEVPAKKAFYIRLSLDAEHVDALEYYEASFKRADCEYAFAYRRSGVGAKKWESYVRIDKDWLSGGPLLDVDVVIFQKLSGGRGFEDPHKLRFLLVPGESSTSASAASDAAITISSTSQFKRGPATDTSAGSDAPLPFPTPNGDGAVLASKPKEQPVGAFARSLVIGKPALLKPSPNNKDGQVFVTTEGETGTRDTAFSRRLRRELSPEVKQESESEGEHQSSQTEPEEQSENEEQSEDEEQQYSEEGYPHDDQLGISDCLCNHCTHARACPSTYCASDGDEEEEEPSEEEAAAREESDNESETSSSREFDEIYRSSSVPEVKTEPMDEAACDAAIDRMREARDACADIIHAALDKYESTFYDAVKALQTAAPDQAAINRKIAFTTQRLELRKTAKACGFKRKRTTNVSSLEELDLSPMIKRLQHVHPARHHQYQNAKAVLAEHDISGDVILELGVSGLQTAGLSLGTAASIVTEVKKDIKERE